MDLSTVQNMVRQVFLTHGVDLPEALREALVRDISNEVILLAMNEAEERFADGMEAFEAVRQGRPRV